MQNLMIGGQSYQFLGLSEIANLGTATLGEVLPQVPGLMAMLSVNPKLSPDQVSAMPFSDVISAFNTLIAS